jgi:mono/diheme cytochrome c family protein
MKTVCAIAIAVLVVAIPLTVWSQNAPDTAQTFKSRCGSCHGSKGEGATAGKVPAIKGTPITIEKIVALITKGTGGVTVHTTPISNITDEQAKALAKYVKDLK